MMTRTRTRARARALTTPDLALLSLATYRLTRLAIEDELTEPVRTKLLNSLRNHPKLSYLLSCPWCISPYAAALLLAIRAIHPPTYRTLATILSASTVTGLLYSNL